jgi:hypothetical protein
MTMNFKTVKKQLQAALLAASLLPAGAALAAISVGTDLGNGALLDLDYGATGNVTQVTPLLFFSEVAGTQPPQAAIGGIPWLSFNAVVSGQGTSVLDMTFTLSNTSAGADVATDLRFMVIAQPDGDGQLGLGASFLDAVSESWGAPIAGDPNARQVVPLLFDLSNSMVGSAAAANGLSDGLPPAACIGGAVCDTEFGLQWNLPSLGAGETWTVNVKLVDDPSLVIGGRYLLATSADTADTALFFGNVHVIPEPQTYAMLLAGLGLLAFLRMRKT